MQQEITFKSNTANKAFNWNDFFAFRVMITYRIIQIVYSIGAVLITLAGLFMLFSGDSNPYSLMPTGPVAGLVLLLFGNILWRIQCELIIVFFRINKTLDEVEINTRHTGG